MKSLLVGLFILTFLAEKGEKSLLPESHGRNPLIAKKYSKAYSKCLFL